MSLLDTLLCWLGRCRMCKPTFDDSGCWGECVICHKRHGFVSRADLRSYLDREQAAQVTGTMK